MMKNRKIGLAICLVLLSVLILCGEIIVSTIGPRYRIIYSSPWIPVVLNGLILLFLTSVFSLLRVKNKNKKRMFWIGMGLFLAIGIGGATQLPSIKANRGSVYSLSPNYQSLFYLKKSGETVSFYQSYYLLFARQREELPYPVKAIGHPIWMDDDVAAVTYEDVQGQLHIYMGTYGSRGSAYSYEYVSSLSRGTWEDKEQQFTLTNHLGNIAVDTATHHSLFEVKQGVQFGKSGFVLIENGHAEYAYAIGKDNHFSEDGNTRPQNSDRLILVQPDLKKMHPVTLYFKHPE